MPQRSSFIRDPRLQGFNLNTQQSQRHLFDEQDFNVFRCPLGHQYETRYQTNFCCPRCHQNYTHANPNVRVCVYNDSQCDISVCGNCIRRINNGDDAAVNMPFLYRNPFAGHQLFIQCGKFTEDMTPLTNGSYLLKLGENLHLFLDLQFEESDLCGHVGSLKILQGMDCDVENIKGFYGCKTSRLALSFTFNNEEIELRGTVHDQGEYVKGIFTRKANDHQLGEEKFTLHRIGFCATAGQGNGVGDKESEGDISLSKLSRYETCMELKERNITKISVKDAFDEKEHETKIFNTISEDNDCQICFDHAIDCVILPCGHLCMCSICGDKMKENPVCPICRTNIKHVMIPH